MPHTVVYIGTEKALLSPLAGLLVNLGTVGFMKELRYPVQVEIGTARPAFPTKEQEEYLGSMGVGRDDCLSCTYRMFIGGVTKSVDYRDGAELPLAVLESYDEFRSQVLHRIRKAVGTPDDN